MSLFYDFHQRYLIFIKDKIFIDNLLSYKFHFRTLFISYLQKCHPCCFSLQGGTRSFRNVRAWYLRLTLFRENTRCRLGRRIKKAAGKAASAGPGHL